MKKKIPTIDWDGEAELIPAKNWLLEDVGIHASYDAICRKILKVIKMPKSIFKVCVFFQIGTLVRLENSLRSILEILNKKEVVCF